MQFKIAEQKWILLLRYTSKLQNLDVLINKLSKEYHVKQNYEEFMIRNEGNTVSQFDVAKWVITAWGKSHVDSICNNTWNLIGINTTMIT